MRVPFFTRPHSGRAHRVAGALAVALGLAMSGCSGTGESAIRAPVHGLAQATGFATTTPEAKDFVRQTRNPDADFMPVGVTPPPRSMKAKTTDEIHALESDLESTLQKHNAAAGRAPSGQVYKSAAGDGPKTAPVPRGADKFVIPPKPAANAATKPAPKTKPKPAAADPTKS